jgi:hypothetical protein
MSLYKDGTILKGMITLYSKLGGNILQKWQALELFPLNAEARNAAICLDLVEIMNP